MVFAESLFSFFGVLELTVGESKNCFSRGKKIVKSLRMLTSQGTFIIFSRFIFLDLFFTIILAQSNNDWQDVHDIKNYLDW